MLKISSFIVLLYHTSEKCQVIYLIFICKFLIKKCGGWATAFFCLSLSRTVFRKAETPVIRLWLRCVTLAFLYLERQSVRLNHHPQQSFRGISPSRHASSSLAVNHSLAAIDKLTNNKIALFGSPFNASTPYGSTPSDQAMCLQLTKFQIIGNC